MIDLFYEDENCESNDHKIDHYINKQAVVEGGDVGFLGICQYSIVVRVGGEFDEKIFKTYFAGDEAYGGHNYVFDEGIDYLAESGTDYDTDGHIDDVAFDGEFTEFFEHAHFFLQIRSTKY